MRDQFLKWIFSAVNKGPSWSRNEVFSIGIKYPLRSRSLDITSCKAVDSSGCSLVSEKFLKSGIAICIFWTEGELISIKILPNPSSGRINRKAKKNPNKQGKLIIFQVFKIKVDLDFIIALYVSLRKRRQRIRLLNCL